MDMVGPSLAGRWRPCRPVPLGAGVWLLTRLSEVRVLGTALMSRTQVREVDRACHGCLYGDTDVYVRPENPGLAHLNDGHTEYEVTQEACEVCDASPSLRKV